MSSIPALLLLLLTRSAVAESPEDYTKRFTTQERIFLAAVLTEPAEAAAFNADAAAGAPIGKWQAKIALYGESYLSRPHGVTLQDAQGQAIRDLKQTVEPGEWAALMESMKALSAGGMIDRAKAEYFSGRLLAADKALKEGNPQVAREVIAMGREQLTSSLKEYVASAPAQQALAAHRAELERARQNAIEQARQAAATGRQAAGAGRPEEAAGGAGSGFENRSGQGPIVSGTPGTDTLPPAAGGTGPATLEPPAPGRGSYAMNPPPAPSDDMAALAEIKQKSGGMFTKILGAVVKFAPAIGAGLGVLLGALFGFGLLMIGVLAMAGAFAGSMLQKKFGGAGA